MNLPPNTFRASVGAIIINGDGRVLAFERMGIKDAWQLPQGGIDDDEDPYEAILREIEEETGLTASDVQLIEEFPEWLAYELPVELQSHKTGRGQVQKWFLFNLISEESAIQLDRSPHPEFSRWKWMTLTDLAGTTISFRQGVYARLAEGFAEYLAAR